MTTRARTPREAIRLIAGGESAVILVVCGWLYSSDLRHPVAKRVREAAATLKTGPVHVRWAWLREPEDGQQQTAFLVWPCLSSHRPGFQCWNGQVSHGNTPFSGKIAPPLAGAT